MRLFKIRQLNIKHLANLHDLEINFGDWTTISGGLEAPKNLIERALQILLMPHLIDKSTLAIWLSKSSFGMQTDLELKLVGNDRDIICRCTDGHFFINSQSFDDALSYKNYLETIFELDLTLLAYLGFDSLKLNLLHDNQSQTAKMFQKLLVQGVTLSRNPKLDLVTLNNYYIDYHLTQERLVDITKKRDEAYVIEKFLLDEHPELNTIKDLLQKPSTTTMLNQLSSIESKLQQYDTLRQLKDQQSLLTQEVNLYETRLVNANQTKSSLALQARFKWYEYGAILMTLGLYRRWKIQKYQKLQTDLSEASLKTKPERIEALVEELVSKRKALNELNLTINQISQATSDDETKLREQKKTLEQIFKDQNTKLDWIHELGVFKKVNDKQQALMSDYNLQTSYLSKLVEILIGLEKQLGFELAQFDPKLGLKHHSEADVLQFDLTYENVLLMNLDEGNLSQAFKLITRYLSELYKVQTFKVLGINQEVKRADLKAGQIIQFTYLAAAPLAVKINQD